MRILLLAMTAFVLAAVVYAEEFPEISLSDLKVAISSGKVTLLDANGTESWQDGHIPGAIDFTAAKGKLDNLLPKDKDSLIVAYCGGPTCGAYAAAAKAARKLGYTHVRHFTAGISGWKQAGEKTEKGN